MTEKKSVQAILTTKNGYYCGTARGDSWWRRYTKGGWLARGNSEVWIEKSGIFFRRYMTKEIKEIPFQKITNIKTGKWHGGKFIGAPVMKVAFLINGEEVWAGICISRNKEETQKWIDTIEQLSGTDMSSRDDIA